MRIGRLLRRMLLLAVLGAVLLVVSLVVLLAVAVERSPLVVEAEVLDPDFAQRARQFSRKTLNALLDERQPVTLRATEKDLNGLLAFAARAVPRLAGRVNVSELGVLGALTLRLPASPLGEYLNVSVQLAPSTYGLQVDTVRVGGMRLPRIVLDRGPRLVLDLVLGSGQGTSLLGAIESVAMSDEAVTMVVDSPRDLEDRVRAALARLGDYRDKAQLLGDPAHIRHYYRLLADIGAKHALATNTSLAEFLGPLFTLARERSRDHALEDENEAAVLALAMYLGSHRFEAVAGAVRDEGLRAKLPPANVVLAGREDLRLHFLISAGLKLVSDLGISIAIGEFKELLDAGEGGTGFSFADLAADRAGVRFASLATDGASGARRMQEALSGDVSEADFFPDIAGLPERLSAQAFQQRYGGVNDPRYRAMLADIDARIEMLPLYRAAADE